MREWFSTVALWYSTAVRAWRGTLRQSGVKLTQRLRLPYCTNRLPRAVPLGNVRHPPENPLPSHCERASSVPCIDSKITPRREGALLPTSNAHAPPTAGTPPRPLFAAVPGSAASEG